METSLSKVKLGVWLVLSLGFFAFLSFIGSIWWELNVDVLALEKSDGVEYVIQDEVETKVDSGEWEDLDDAMNSLVAGQSFKTGYDGEVGLFLKGVDLIRLYPNTEIYIESIDLDSMPVEVEFSLVTGAVWVSDLQGVSNIVVSTDRVRVEPELGSVYVNYLDQEVNVFAAHHPTKVSFLDESGEVLNAYAMTESHEVSIKESTLTDVLSQLRYTKLTKEYPFVYVDSENWDEVWMTGLESDQDRLADVYSEFVHFLRREVDPGHEEGSFGYKVNEFYKAVRSVLTFSDSHLMQIEEDEDLELFYQGLYFILQDNFEDGEERLEAFEEQAKDFENLEKIDSLVQVFQSIHWGQDFYEAEELIRDIRYNASLEEDKLSLSLLFLRERLNEIYDLLDQGERVDAINAFVDYMTVWEDLISEYGVELEIAIPVITEERQIVQNMIYREDTFYTVEAYGILSLLEDRILNLTAAEYDLNEEKQAFIQDRLRVLNRLVGLIDEDLVGVDDGVELGFQLVDESEWLLSNVTSNAAINSYFVQKLEEFQSMFEFIDSPDYLFGEGTLDDRFEAYLEKEAELDELSEYILGLTEEDESEIVSLDQAQSIVESSFDAEGISYSALVHSGDGNFRLFTVQGGRVGLIDFDASYDRVTETVYDLEVEGEIFSAAVKLENLSDAIQSTINIELEDVVFEVVVDTDASLSAVESFAIDRVQEELDSSGLEVELSDISILDLELNLFHIQTVLAFSGIEINVDFDYLLGSEEATNIVGDVEGNLFAVDPAAIGDLEMAARDGWQLYELEFSIEE
jgi:hypothetical protein